MEAFREKTVGTVIVVGCIVCVASLILAFMFAGGGIFHATATRDAMTNQITDMGDSFLTKFAILGFFGGLAMIGGGLGYGIYKHRNRMTGPSKTLSNVRVIARFGYSKDWVMLSEPWQFEEAEDPTYYLKLETSPGVIEEYECRPETYFAAGEGMYGDVALQGKWCGRFFPYIGIRNETVASDVESSVEKNG